MINSEYSYCQGSDPSCANVATGIDDSSVAENDKKHDNEDDMVRVTNALKVNGTILGWMIGVFIQCSSLGANQFLTMNNNQSLLWSCSLWMLLISAMGVTMFWLLRRSILSAATNFSSSQLLRSRDDHDDDDEEEEEGEEKRLQKLASSSLVSYLFIMDVCFSLGALAGACMAWMVTDVALLGWYNPHSCHSAMAVAMTTLICNIVVRNWLHPHSSTTSSSMPTWSFDLEQPLLSENDGFIVHIPTSTQNTTRTTLSSSSGTSLRPTALVLGGLVGIFIQCSSLGANILSEKMHLDSDQLLIFSLLWSVWASVMGIGNLFIIRRILTLFLEVSDRQLAHFDCCFAIGATLGLNAARAVTDLAMGSEMNMAQLLITLPGTLLWCRLIIFFYGWNP